MKGGDGNFWRVTTITPTLVFLELTNTKGDSLNTREILYREPDTPVPWQVGDIIPTEEVEHKRLE